MRVPLLLLVLAATLAVLIALVNPNVHPAPSATASAVAVATPAPAADAAVGQLVLERCGGCHGLQVLSQRPQDAAGWRQTVVMMQSLGAQVTPQESDSIVDYLARHFGK